MKPCFSGFLILLVAISNNSFSQTILSLIKNNSPTLPNSGLIVNGGFETGAPPINTWYQWAKTGCSPGPANHYPTGWTVTAAATNSAAGSPIRYATWGRLVTGTGGSGTYPFIPTNQSGLYEVYSTTSTACSITNTTASSSDPGTFPLGVASADGNNYLYFGNGTGTITGFPTPLASWVSSTNSPNNLRVYADNSSLGTLTGPAPVTLAQTVTTTIGSTYALEFWVSGEELSAGSQSDGFFQLEIGTQKLYLPIPGSANDHGLGSQFYYQIEFIAASSSTLIRFTNYCHPVAGNWSGYLNGSVSSELLLDDVRLELSSLIPIRLLQFSGNTAGENVELSWRVASDIKFQRFEIERSSTALGTFSRVGEQLFNRSNLGNYTYRDPMPASLSHQDIFYRLKMIDVNDRVTYSPVIVIKFFANSALTVAVSPSNDYIIVAGLRSAGHLTIVDVSGKTLLREKTHSTTQILPITSLTVGLYLLNYYDKDKVYVQKFIKR